MSYFNRVVDMRMAQVKLALYSPSLLLDLNSRCSKPRQPSAGIAPRCRHLFLIPLPQPNVLVLLFQLDVHYCKILFSEAFSSLLPHARSRRTRTLWAATSLTISSRVWKDGKIAVLHVINALIALPGPWTRIAISLNVAATLKALDTLLKINTAMSLELWQVQTESELKISHI